jgi:head-tail adaptor
MMIHTLFNQRIRVEYCESQEDALGEDQDVWREYGYIWAGIRRLALAGRHSTEHFRIRARSRTHLPRKVRFVWAGRVLHPLMPPLREERKPWVDWIVENQEWLVPHPQSYQTTQETGIGSAQPIPVAI